MAITVSAPPSTTKLIALVDLKDVLGITDSASDALLGQIIQRGSDAIARFCNRVYTQRTVVEAFPGPGGQLLILKFLPIVTLTSIAFDGETVDPDTYTLTEPDAGIVFREVEPLTAMLISDALTGYVYDRSCPRAPLVPPLAKARAILHQTAGAADDEEPGAAMAARLTPSAIAAMVG